MVTDGVAPGPTTVVEEILDPFVLSAAGSGDVWSVLETLEALAGGVRGPLSSMTLEPPVRPSKILAVGRNFAAHAAEMGNEAPAQPILFFKPPSCLVASGAPVHLPSGYDRIDMEGEMVVVIGKPAKNVPAGRALDHVAGYTLGNDVSCRDLQRRDKQWTRAKGFDGFGPLGPFVRVTRPGTALPGDELRLRAYLDDELRQDAPLSEMIFDVPTIIAHISECMTLEPGDLIYMGTPRGVAQLGPGQVMRVELDGLDLGRLTNPLLG